MSSRRRGPQLQSVDGSQTSSVEEARRIEYGDQLFSFAASGIPIAQGARALSIPEPTARRYFKDACERHAGMSAEDKRDAVAVQLETVRLIIQAHMPLAIGSPGRQGRAAVKASIGSGQLVLAALQRQADLMGLDAALTIQVSNKAVDDAVDDIRELIAVQVPVELPALPPTAALMPGDASGDAG